VDVVYIFHLTDISHFTLENGTCFIAFITCWRYIRPSEA